MRASVSGWWHISCRSGQNLSAVYINNMKISELRNLTKEDLLAKIKTLKNELFKLNLQRFGGRVEKPHMFSLIKKDIARINTILNEKKEK